MSKTTTLYVHHNHCLEIRCSKNILLHFFSDQEAKRHLERFLYKAQGLSSEAPHVLEVCLLVVRCMEVGLQSCTFSGNLVLRCCDSTDFQAVYPFSRQPSWHLL